MRTALVVVDIQNDFCEGGALAVEGGNQVALDVAQQIKETAAEYDFVVFTQDWHQPFERDPRGNCGHFAIPPAKPDYVDTWPEHCVQATSGADLHLAIVEARTELPMDKRLMVQKGQGVPAYSGFDGAVAYGLYKGATLASVLLGTGVQHLDVVGLAYDHCVAATAIAGAKLGIEVEVYSKLCRPVSIVTAELADERMTAAGVSIA